MNDYKVEYEKLLIYTAFSVIGVLIVYLLSIFFIEPKISLNYISMIITNITVSRVVSISIGHGLTLEHYEIILINFITEGILVFIIYSLFLYSLKKVEFFKPLTQKIQQLQDIALEHKTTVDKYGLVGLFFFVFIPFWMTGPIVGVIIGHLMNLHPLKNIIVVLSGTLVAITLWSISLQNVMQTVGF